MIADMGHGASSAWPSSASLHEPSSCGINCVQFSTTATVRHRKLHTHRSLFKAVRPLQRRRHIRNMRLIVSYCRCRRAVHGHCVFRYNGLIRTRQRSSDTDRLQRPKNGGSIARANVINIFRKLSQRSQRLTMNGSSPASKGRCSYAGEAARPPPASW